MNIFRSLRAPSSSVSTLEKSTPKPPLPQEAPVEKQTENEIFSDAVHVERYDFLNDAVSITDADFEPNFLEASRKSSLLAYQHLTPNTIISASTMDAKGNLLFRTEKAPQTFWGKTLLFLFLDHKPFVDEFFSVLKANYGEEIASKAFPREVQKEATQSGLSQAIVFNSLKKSLQASLTELREKLVINPADSPEKVKALLDDIAQLLEEAPHAPTDADTKNFRDTRTTFTKAVSLIAQITDTTMSLKSSVAWGRRVLFALEVLALI